jgi:hypothetical protein
MLERRSTRVEPVVGGMYIVYTRRTSCQGRIHTHCTGHVQIVHDVVTRSSNSGRVVGLQEFVVFFCFYS